MSGVGGFILNLLGGGIVEKFTGPLVDAYKLRLSAQNDEQRLQAEQTIARLEAARDIAVAESGRAWSATSVGRWLIVVPFGVWWAAIFTLQIVNPWILQPLFDVRATVTAIPPDIMEMAKILVPAIVIADAGALASSRLRR